MEYDDELGHHIESDGKNDPVIVYAWEVRATKRFCRLAEIDVEDDDRRSGGMGEDQRR